MPISDDAIRKYQSSYLRCRHDETVADALYRLRDQQGYAWWYVIVEFPDAHYGAVQAGALWTQFEQATDPDAFLRRRLGDLGLPGVRVAEKGSMGTAQAEALVPLVQPMVLVVVDRGQFVGILTRFDRGGPIINMDYDRLDDVTGSVQSSYGAPGYAKEEAAPESEMPGWLRDDTEAGAIAMGGAAQPEADEQILDDGLLAPMAPPATAAPPPAAPLPPPPPSPVAAPAPAQPQAAPTADVARASENAGEVQAFNVLIVDGKTRQPLPAVTPLLARRPDPYYLRVFIGPWLQEQALERADRFADSREVREQVFREGQAHLLCVITTSTAVLENNRPVLIRELVVPERGSSNVIQVALSAPEPGHHFVDVDLYFHNQLLHSKTLSFYAVSAEGERVDGLATTKVTFVRERGFTPKELDDRVTRLTLRYAPASPERGASFTVLTPGQTAQETPFYTDVAPENLKKFADSARKWLAEVAKANQTGGAGTWNTFATHLPRLAKIGSEFYWSAFAEQAGRDALAALRDPSRDVVIQIAPIASNASVPWNIVYDRPLSQATYVCDKFAGHGLHDCPYKDRDDVVCPTGFWGYRHMIEQIPCWSDDPLLQPLINRPDQVPQLQRFVRNRPSELVYCYNAYPFGPVVDQHRAYIQKLAGRAGLSLRQAQSIADVRQQFTQGDIHVVHFFVHGGEEDGRHLLILRDNQMLDSATLLSWGARLWDEAPLVLLSGCGTGSYTPDDFSSLISAMLRSGVAGVIGTEVPIYTGTALAFANEFFEYLLRGSAAGYALRDITRRLMAQFNPHGLIYTLFAVSGIRLRHALLSSR